MTLCEKFHSGFEYLETKKNVYKMADLLSEYGFKDIGGYYCDVYKGVYQYTGTDVISKDEATKDYELLCEREGLDWCDIEVEYEEYCNTFEQLVIKHFEEALVKINEANIDYIDWTVKEDDYSYIIITFKLE